MSILLAILAIKLHKQKRGQIIGVNNGKRVNQNKFFECNVVNISYVSFKHMFLALKRTGAQKNCLIETVLLSTNNICFG